MFAAFSGCHDCFPSETVSNLMKKILTHPTHSLCLVWQGKSQQRLRQIFNGI